MQLLFATGNQNKVNEVRAKLGAGYQINDLSTIPFKGELPETHETLWENAKEKAMFVYENFGRNCFAEDSGLMIDALNGAPGVYSARYAGIEKNDTKNIEKVLQEMKGKANRQAKFMTVIALVIDYTTYLFEGEVKGEILTSPVGENGFGYDPIFKPEGFNCSFAELSLEEKIQLSHRSIATAKMIDFLNELNQFKPDHD
jgi:XTP/dITP diphosphohydrolase